MPSSKLILGNVIFKDFEIPSRLDGLGGTHKLSIFDYVGANKGVHALGPKPDDISWAGAFVYVGAADRVKIIDQYRISGEVVRLSWSEFAYNVIVKAFQVSAHHEYEYEYKIVLEVVEDLTNVPTRPSVSSVDEGINNAFSKGGKALNNLQGNSNFIKVALPNSIDLPDDPATTLAYVKDPIDIQPPTEIIQTTGANG